MSKKHVDKCSGLDPNATKLTNPSDVRRPKEIKNAFKHLRPRKAMTAVQFVAYLKKLPGAIPYDGDASVQVVFKLANGMNLRIGVSDSDCTDQLGLWADNYAGLGIVGGDAIS